jgi:hypothetical protein
MLHGVLRRHPELVPAADLGFGRVVTVGFETNLPSGAADLVLMDETGRLCVVEVKKEGNTDTRRVVAQVMDYAAALWGMTLASFEHDVLSPTLGPDDSRGLREFVIDELVAGTDDVDEAADQVLEVLSATLRSGDFALVVAAPLIPDGVQRVIEYLNAQGLSLYGLEVSYFAGDVEAFVPRIVVRPTLGGRLAGPDGQTENRSNIDAETYFGLLPEHLTEAVRRFVDEVPSLGAELQWRSYGPRVRVRGSAGLKVVASLETKTAYLTVGPLKGVDPHPAIRAVEALRTIAGVKIGGTYSSISLRSATGADAEAFLAVARQFVLELVGDVDGTGHAA